MGDSEPLVHHLKASDWHAQASGRRASASTGRHGLPGLELDGHDSLKQTLSNEKLSSETRLNAAKELVQDGMHWLRIKDRQGEEHDYQIRLFNSGQVRVTEDGHNVLTPADCGGGAQRPANRHGGKRAAPHPTECASAAPHPRVIDPFAPPVTRSDAPEHRGAHSQRLVITPGRLGDTGGQGDRHADTAVKNSDGSVSISFTGCATDTDGRGASRHREDSHRKPHTALSRSDGQSLDTDKDSYIVLSPSVAAKFGIHKGDLGRLICKDTGRSVPVVFGDVGHEGRTSAEASLAALRRLGFSGIDGNNGISGGQFEIVITPGSGNGRGDIARNPQKIASKLERENTVATDL